MWQGSWLSLAYEEYVLLLSLSLISGKIVAAVCEIRLHQIKAAYLKQLHLVAIYIA